MSKSKKARITPSSTVKLSTQERHKRVWEALFYSHQRMDVLLIAISGGGIYVSLETLKYFITKGENVDLLFKIPPTFLVVAIIFNFLSQWCSSKVHYSDFCISSIDLGCQEEGTDRNLQNDYINDHECKIKIYSKLDRFLSISSIVLMSLGLIGIISYFFITF